jgi:hypothetical protein
VADGLARHRSHVLPADKRHPRRALPVLARLEREDSSRRHPGRRDADTEGTENETADPAPALRRLAVIAAGSSVQDVIARLARVQYEHPGAQVRAGEHGAWEIWSGPDAD